jgi:pullulanase
MNLYQARLLNNVDVIYTSSQTLSSSQIQSIKLIVNSRELLPLTFIKEEKTTGFYTYQFRFKDPFTLGHSYGLVIENIGTIPIHVDALMQADTFDKEFDASKEHLGYRYQKDKTLFQVWAPIASMVDLIFYDVNGHKIQVYSMKRKPNGVYHVEVKGNHDGQHYRYGIVNHGQYQESIDPYSFGLSQNSVDSVVINLEDLKIPMNDASLPKLKDYQDAIIYEAHVRDLSSDTSISFTHPRTFLGAIEKNKKTKLKHAVGFDYLTSLGITHLQLLPVTDYRSVNEFNVAQSYNWGYDPYHYFSLEGSFASTPKDPRSRIQDFMKLVSQYHQAGIRINIDVVYNHVYDYQHSPFEKIVPGYYFRKHPNGQMSNGSYCGNDLATEKPMVRHLIVQAATFTVSTYHVDGFRFDLMGIIDRETLYQIQHKVRKIKPDFMLYGEGWNMPTYLPQEQKGITENSHLLPDFAFFNDLFRNTLKGGNNDHDLNVPGFATGNLDAGQNLPSLLLGSYLTHLGPTKVSHPSQSINYVECHDNNTFFDKLMGCQANEGEMFHLRRIIFANSLILFSNGIPFFHMAQEVGGSKNGDHNSFQSGDKVNQFEYRLLDERPWMVKAFQDLIQLRKMFRGLAPKGWDESNLTFHRLSHGAISVHYHLGKEHFVLIWNPSLHQIMMPTDLQNLTLIFDGESQVKQPLNLSHIPPLRFLMLKQ